MTSKELTALNFGYYDLTDGIYFYNLEEKQHWLL